MVISKDTIDLKTLSPLTLAYIGDGVYELMMRKKLILSGNCQPGKLHQCATGMVNAASQAKGAKIILPLLTPQEETVYKRGRNAHPGHVPKSSSVGDYHSATGLECLFGYLYLDNQEKRLNELFDIIYTNINQK